MHHRVVQHLRANVLAYLAIGLALGAGGGYAIAAGRSSTITACADRHTGVLHLSRRGRCERGQSKVRWNQQGPQGIQGQPGAQGAAGQDAVKIWGTALSDGSPGNAGEHGFTVQRTATGSYQVTITDSRCTSAPAAPEITVDDLNPPSGHVAGAYPLAWVTNGTGPTFTVSTGVAVGGAFSLENRSFNVQDVC